MTDADLVAQPSIYAGAKAPESLTIVIWPGPGRIDLSKVTGVELAVHNGITPDTTWTAAVVQQRADKLIVQHVFDTAGAETRQPGRYRIISTLTIPTGVRRTTPFYFAVLP